MLTSHNSSVDLLVLGGGWTFEFLKPLLDSKEYKGKVSYVATTRDGRDGTLKWSWNADDDSQNDYDALPSAKTVVVVFPLKGKGTSKQLVEGYEKGHGPVRWIQLGSTGIFDVSRLVRMPRPNSSQITTFSFA